MSERRAKRERKENEATKVVVKKKDPARIVSNLIIVVVIAAVAGLGIFATWDNIVAVFNTSDVQTQTIADVAKEEGLTVDELLEKCGMTDLGLTAKSAADDLYAKFTIDSYAKFEDKTAEELKAENGIEDLANDTNWMEASMKIPMGKMAEQSGMTFEDFAKQNSLPEEITADMTYEEAMAVYQEQLMAAQNAEGEATTENE